MVSLKNFRGSIRVYVCTIEGLKDFLIFVKAVVSTNQQKLSRTNYFMSYSYTVYYIYMYMQGKTICVMMYRD